MYQLFTVFKIRHVTLENSIYVLKDHLYLRHLTTQT